MADSMTYARVNEPHTWFDCFETPEERALRAEVRAFAWEHFEDLRDEIDAKGRCDHLMPLLGERGYLGTLVRPEYGGTGLGLGASVVIAQELGGVIPSLAALRAVSGVFVAKPLEEFGTPTQIDQWLRPIMTGEYTTAVAMTEPQSGSDLAAMRTTAVRDGEGWVLNGAKKFISGAAESNFILCYVTTNPEAGPHQRLSGFIIPTDHPGVDVSHAALTMGVKGLSHSYVYLNDVRLGPEHLLGQPGDGLRMLEFLLAAERIDIAARALGNATRAFEEARAYADVRHASGRPIRKFQAINHRLADMRATLDAGRLLVLRAARYYDQALAEHGAEAASRICNEEASIAKLYCPEKGFWVCDQAMQIMGGHGYEQGTAVEAMFRDVRVLRFGGGTDEIQRHIVQRDDYQRFHQSRAAE